MTEPLLGQNTYIIFLLQERHDDLQVIVSAIGKNAQMPKVTPLMMNEIEKVRLHILPFDSHSCSTDP